MQSITGKASNFKAVYLGNYRPSIGQEIRIGKVALVVHKKIYGTKRYLLEIIGNL